MKTTHGEVGICTARQTSADSARDTSRLSGPFLTPAEEGPREDTPRRAPSLLQAVSLQEAQEGQAPSINLPSVYSTIYRSLWVRHVPAVEGVALSSTRTPTQPTCTPMVYISPKVTTSYDLQV